MLSSSSQVKQLKTEILQSNTSLTRLPEMFTLTPDFCSSQMQKGRTTISSKMYSTTTRGRIHLLQFPQEQGILTWRRCEGPYGKETKTTSSLSLSLYQTLLRLDTFNVSSALFTLNLHTQSFPQVFTFHSWGQMCWRITQLIWLGCSVASVSSSAVSPCKQTEQVTLESVSSSSTTKRDK